MSAMTREHPDWENWEREVLNQKGWTLADTVRHYTKLLWGDKVALVAALILVLVVGGAIFAPILTPHLPGKGTILDALEPIGAENHIMGTDTLGRDIFSRLIYGGRVSLRIGLIVVGVAGAVGTFLGLLAGFYGKWIDNLIMRLIDIQFAFPGTLIALAFVLVLGVGERNVIIALAFNGWMVYARMIRGLVMTMREGPLVEAARALGIRPRRIIFRHVFPNVLSPMINLYVLEIARIILAESVLSFLGFGIQPPNSSWGLMIAEGKNYVTVEPRLVVIPGLVIGITVLALNIIANWFLGASDPVLRKALELKRMQKGVQV